MHRSGTNSAALLLGRGGRPGGAPDRGDGQRSGAVRGARAEDARAVFHDQDAWSGARPGHGPAHRRGAWGPDQGRKRARGWNRHRGNLAARSVMNRSLRIVVADDELDMRDYLQRMPKTSLPAPSR